jgi:hypothetical protein
MRVSGDEDESAELLMDDREEVFDCPLIPTAESDTEVEG